MNKQELRETLEEICAAEGVTLFEVEGMSSPTLRVFIHRREGGIQHTQCAGVSHRILNHPRVEEILPGNMLLEVSSPGINRKLTKPEHYSEAVGERIRVSFRNELGQKTTVTGNLEQFDGEVLMLHCVEGKKISDHAISLQNVQEAKVDFLFE